MERRVTSRKPRPLGSGPSGRGPRRKAEIDYWMAAGLYDFKNEKPDVKAGVATHGRLSTARVREGQMEAARLTYETAVAPLLRNSPDLIDLYLLINPDRYQLSSISIWASPDAFAQISSTSAYREVMQALATHFDLQDDALCSDDVNILRLTTAAVDEEETD